MEITLTKDQQDALSIAAVESNTTPEALVQFVVTEFADQMIYKYLLPVGDRLASLKADVERLTAENIELKAQLATTATRAGPIIG